MQTACLLHTSELLQSEAVNWHFSWSWEPLQSLGVSEQGSCQLSLTTPLPRVYPPPQEASLSPVGKEVGVSFNFRGTSSH